MLKKVLGVFLLFAVNVSVAAAFSDVTDDEWFAPYVNDLVAKKVIDNGENFRPGANINRAELSKMIVIAFNLMDTDGTAKTFTDVPSGAWFAKYVDALSRQGIIDGYGNGKFGPADYVTREQAAKMISGAELGISYPDALCLKEFSDVSNKRWSYNAIQNLYGAGDIDGYSDGKFYPEKFITRAEIAKILYFAVKPGGRCFHAESDEITSYDEDHLEVCFANGQPDNATGTKAENYSIVDNNGVQLKVLSVYEIHSSCVHLKTETQVPGKEYILRANNLVSTDGYKLVDNPVVFKGSYKSYNEAGLECELADSSVDKSLAIGSTNVEFMRFWCEAGENDVVLKGINFTHSGNGSLSDLGEFFVFNGTVRISGGRMLNSTNNLIEFSELNIPFKAGEIKNFTLNGSIRPDAKPFGEHRFEIKSSADIESNTTLITGNFPLLGYGVKTSN